MFVEANRNLCLRIFICIDNPFEDNNNNTEKHRGPKLFVISFQGVWRKMSATLDNMVAVLIALLLTI